MPAEYQQWPVDKQWPVVLLLVLFSPLRQVVDALGPRPADVREFAGRPCP